MKSVMDHSFSRVPTVNIPRSTFDRSHGHKTAFDSGLLIPFFLDEALPGDTFNLKTSGFARMSTPEFPVMDRLFMDTFFFSVPKRLVWDNWRKFCGEQEDPGDSIDYTIPSNTSTHTGTLNNLSDYFGIPLVASLSHNVLPLRAYWLIWNEWFRDQNLQNSADVLKDDTGNITTGNANPSDSGSASVYAPAIRGKRHDYFTSCLPWPNKSGTDVSLPLGTEAKIHTATGVGVASDYAVYSDLDSAWRKMDSSGTYVKGTATAGTSSQYMYADLSTATAATINDLRENFQIQRLLEKDARSGTRYAEIIASHFGVQFVDAHYRPEYLGGGSSPINITPIPSSYDDGTNKTTGDLGAMGTVSFNGHGFVKSFTEHCYVIGIVNVRADLTYSQGLNRLWSRATRYDVYWPSLAQIGEQAVLNKEIWADTSANDDLVFGYQERYAEYRYKPSLVTGIFRPDAAGSLDAWHLSEDFASLPSLNASFIRDPSATTVDRVIATPSEPQWIADFYFDFKCARPMPLYGVPGMIDHF